jgi:tRNA A37 threonylcarbamoyladenosine synthetase subunit TsaC/SUA5/YrdC
MATSANLEGHPTPSSLEEVIAQFGDAEGIGYAVDGGDCGTEPSAVVEIVGGRARILRPHPLLDI